MLREQQTTVRRDAVEVASTAQSNVDEVILHEFVPPLLARGRVEHVREMLVAEHLPVGPTECAIIADLARQAVAMERWGTAAEAVERHATRTLPNFAKFDETNADSMDALWSGAMCSDAADRCERHSLGHSRAFYRALQKLQEIQTQRQKRHQAIAAASTPSFANEAACEAYLAERLQSGKHRCSHCRANKGYYYPARRTWECRGCKVQVGLRTETVMARSPLALMQWFAAIRALLLYPTIGTAEMGRMCGIRRPTTIRTISMKIREAMTAPDATERLAGLDRHFWGACKPESGVRHK